MRIRLSLTLDLSRRRQVDHTEPEFEHRDNDTAIEATYGGDQTLHRMGFAANPESNHIEKPRRLP